MMSRPFIQIDDEVREMTEQEYDALLATGWTLEAQDAPITDTATPDA
jgi:hypothetical protein